jgi:hypothetical protein
MRKTTKALSHNNWFYKLSFETGIYPIRKSPNLSTAMFGIPVTYSLSHIREANCERRQQADWYKHSEGGLMMHLHLSARNFLSQLPDDPQPLACKASGIANTSLHQAQDTFEGRLSTFH